MAASTPKPGDIHYKPVSSRQGTLPAVDKLTKTKRDHFSYILVLFNFSFLTFLVELYDRPESFIMKVRQHTCYGELRRKHKTKLYHSCIPYIIDYIRKCVKGPHGVYHICLYISEGTMKINNKILPNFMKVPILLLFMWAGVFEYLLPDSMHLHCNS